MSSVEKDIVEEHMNRFVAFGLFALSVCVIGFTGLAGAGDPHAASATPAAGGAHSAAPAVTPDQALQNLKDGNARYVAGKSQNLRRDARRRAETVAGGQHPFAVVLSCSDSREPVEILFDQGIGDLFVVRVAGNVADVDELGTMEYGADHLGAPLIVVLGHSKCGAVTAVVKGEHVSGNIPQLVDNIIPAAAKSKAKNLTGDALIADAVKSNVMQSIEDTFKNSDVLRERVAGGKLRIVGGVYDLEKGAVEWLGEHPDQGKLVMGGAMFGGIKH
jgi:carbonic anhydrase